MLCELRLESKGYQGASNVFSVLSSSLIAMQKYFTFKTSTGTPMQIYYKDIIFLQIDDEVIHKPNYEKLADKIMTLGPK